MKALDCDSECFQHIVSAFPKLSFHKIKAGAFDGPQLRTLVCNEEFVNKMNDKERVAWLSFVEVTQNFLGNKKADNYHVLVTTMLLAYRDLGCKMSIKLHFLSDEQGERFHQDLMTMENCYQGRWDRNMMADYCWSIKRDCPEEVYKHRSYKRKILPEQGQIRSCILSILTVHIDFHIFLFAYWLNVEDLNIDAWYTQSSLCGSKYKWLLRNNPCHFTLGVQNLLKIKTLNCKKSVALRKN